MDKQTLEYHLNKFKDISKDYSGLSLGVSYILPDQYVTQGKTNSVLEIKDYTNTIEKLPQNIIAQIFNNFEKEAKQGEHVHTHNKQFIHTNTTTPFATYQIIGSVNRHFNPKSANGYISQGQLMELSKMLLDKTTLQNNMTPFLITANFDVAGPFNETIDEDIYYSKILK